MASLRRRLCALMILALCMHFMPGAVFAAAAEEETAAAAEETTLPTETVTEPTEETTLPTETVTEPTEETTLPAEEAAEETTEPAQKTVLPEQPKGWGLYFGQLHSHSDISDGAGTVEEAFAYAATVPNLDFFAVTDHSESISGSDTAVLTEDMTLHSADWAAGKAAAAAATNRDFVGIYGFEMSWYWEKKIGHINTFHTPGFASWKQPAFSEFAVGLENYAAALEALPRSVSQFNHPGTEYGDFQGFTQYSAAVDRAVQLLEVGSGKRAYAYYTQALDYGWHVAPTCNQNNHDADWGAADSGRTVVLAESLTEEGIYDALGSYRVYATRDSDLQIFFDNMGRRLARRDVGSELTLRARIFDPTDAIGTVDVITTEGEVIASDAVEDNSGEFSFTVPADYDYYYLRITQPDGDTAVTAPVWLEGEPERGISGFVCQTELPIQGQPLSLKLTLYNGGNSDLPIERIDFSIGGEVFHSTTELTSVPAGKEAAYSFSPALYHLGVTAITAAVTVVQEGETKTYEKTLTISLRREDMLADILVDAAHGNAGTERLQNLTALAADNRVDLTLGKETITPQQLAKAGILLVTAPETVFSEEFVKDAAEFAAHGGTLILCGRSAEKDGAVSSSGQLNRILAASGSTLSLQADTALDEDLNGGQPDWLYPEDINRTVSWCEKVAPNQVYRHLSGCTVNPGSGTWLVRNGADGAALLAWEALPGGGNVFAAGSLWLLEEELTPPRNLWDAPYANRTIAEAVLGITPPEITSVSIDELIWGQICTIRGYVTAGTARPGNRFPETIYLQDNTGGIAVTPFAGEGISVGTPLEITGYLEAAGKNRQFHMISCSPLEVDAYRFEGLTGTYRELMDNSLHGGELIQIEGTVERVQLAEDGVLSQIILRDGQKNYATVLVEPYIRSGSTGENTLAQEVRAGQKVRAFGILHMHTDGTSVIRVRNCDEVIVIDPWPYTPDKIRDKSNPQSGDPIDIWLGLMTLSGGLLLRKKRKK